jgi:anti-anti-sigma factor
MTRVRQERNVTIIELDAEYGALNRETFNAARELLLSEARTVEPPLVALDLSRTAYMGSAFVEVMFRAWKRLRERNGRLVLCGLQPFCADVLRTLQLDTMFEMFPNVDEALADLG